jgi:hypothetical protein
MSFLHLNQGLTSLPWRILVGCFGLLSACQPDHTPDTVLVNQSDRAPVTVTGKSAILPASANKIQAKGFNPSTLSPELHQAIQQTVARLDRVRVWSAIRKKPLYASTEGGEAVLYTLSGHLCKVAACYFGETGQLRSTYYLLHGQPSFVLEQEYTYNRPITWDSAVMRAGHDQEVFDPKKSIIVTTRSYFDSTGRLVAQVGPAVQDSVLILGYLGREQHRLQTELAALRER